MKTLVMALTALAVLVCTTLFWRASARAHGWYPKECCSDMDCAPVESMARFVPIGGGAAQLIVTSKHGKAIVPQNIPVRESKDSRMHVCMRYDEFGHMDVICLFMPPSM